MSCSDGRFKVISDSATGAIVSIVEIMDAAGAYLNPQNVITATGGASSDGEDFATVLGNLKKCFTDDLEITEDYICVTGNEAAGDLSPAETFKMVTKCDQNNVVRVRNVFAADGITPVYQGTFDPEGAVIEETGAIPVEYTLGACQTNLISTCATL